MLSIETALLALALLGSGQGETVLLDFSADYCIPCRQMDPVVRELVARGYPVRKINIDRNRALAAHYGVDRVPCFVMLVDGQVVDRVVGGTTFSRLERMCRLAQACQQATPLPAYQTPTTLAGSGLGASPNPAHAPFPDAARLSTSEPPANQGQTPASLAGLRRGTPSWQGTTDGTSLLDQHLVAATVRLRIEDPNGHSCGSGTIIDARDGEALILTCGHIFRDSQGQGRIEVDLFGPHPAERIPGRLLSYDLERDLGLLTIPIPGPVAAARVAGPEYRVAKDDPVVNVGCNNGESPTARHSRVTAVDRYLGPPNLEVAGTPVLGRSGGGLFSREGLVIGVCTAADPSDNEGLYTALSAIQGQLDKANLTSLYRSGRERSIDQGSLVAMAPPAVPKRMPPPSDLGQQASVPARPTEPRTDPQAPSAPAQLSGEEQAALEEIRRRRLEGAEVVCVIRSRSDPRAPSEIIVLDHVSPRFLDRLATEASGEGLGARHFTSLEVPDRTASLHGTPGGAFSRPPAREPLVEFRTADRRDPTAWRRAAPWQPLWRNPETQR